MPNIRFARFLVIESIPPKQYKSGHQLYAALKALATEQQIPIDVEYFSVSSIADFDALLHTVLLDCRNTARVPLLHFECHGNDDGIVLANGEMKWWLQLAEQLTEINLATGLNLFVSVAACFGAYLASQFVPINRAPFSAALSTTKTAMPDELYRGFSTFYGTLFRTMDANQALRDLTALNKKENQSFYLAEATHFFIIAYRGYLEKYCTPQAYRDRARALREVQIDRNLPIEDELDLLKRLVQTSETSFEKFKSTYFMIDLFPENAERFKVTEHDVQPRYLPARSSGEN